MKIQICLKKIYSLLCVFFLSFFINHLHAQSKLIGTTSRAGEGFGSLFSIEPGATALSSLMTMKGTVGRAAFCNKLCEAPNGKFYGVSPEGGLHEGVIFEYDYATGIYTNKIDMFDATGGRAYGSLIMGPTGKLLGITKWGGANDLGAIFEYDYVNNIYTDLVDMEINEGARTEASFVQASNGKFYCITNVGGGNGLGTLIEYDHATNTLTKKVDMSDADGWNGFYSMKEAPNGKLYGVVSNGGANGLGSIFEYDVINDIFSKKIDMSAALGSSPYASLFLAANGKFYGTTNSGGANDLGVIFEYDYTTNVYTKKMDLTSANGAVGQGALMQASDGKLYALTYQGGANNAGVIFQYDYTNNTYNKKIDLVASQGISGACELAQASNGKLYGTTYGGGKGSAGVVFEYDPAANIYSKKIDLEYAESGSSPFATPVKASNGKVYCVTRTGGAENAGSIVEYDYNANTYTKKADFTLLSGGNAYGTMTQAANGKLYGLANLGGVNNEGTIYEYDYNSNVITKKLDLAASTGKLPLGSLLQAGNGKFYGTTSEGGTDNNGVLFEYDYSTNIYTKLVDFSSVAGRPSRTIMEAANGKIYGSTDMTFTAGRGTIFEYDYNTHTYTTKINLTSINGQNPSAAMMEAGNHKLYGMTPTGGANGLGTIYEYDYTTNTYTKKIDLGPNGYSPYGTMVQSSNGKLYGFTFYGGDYDAGVIFEYDYITNTYTKKITFDGSNGKGPYSDLIEVGASCTPAATPVLSATGTTICSGSSVTLSIQSGQLNESTLWSWYSGSCGGTFLGSGSSITLTPASSDTYYARGEGGCATNGDCSSITVDIAGTLISSVTITSDLGNVVCAGASATFTATPVNGGINPVYQWTKNGLNVGTSSNTYTGGFFDSGDVINCFLTSSEGCVSNSPATSNTLVLVVRVPTNSVTNIFLCPDQLPYNWNGTDYSIPGSYQASFTNGAGCDSTAFLNLSLNAAAIAGITNNTGTTELTCAITSINVTATGGVDYSWSNGLGNNANAIITSAGTYTVTVTNADGCIADASITVSVSSAGLPAPADINGPINVCPFIATGDQLVYSATTVPGATSYQWTVPSTVNIISGQGTNILTVTISNGFITSPNKQLRVRAIAACGTSSYTIKYLVAQIPGTVAAITGPTDICPYLGNSIEVTYSIPASAGAVTYQWTVPPGAFITQNNGTDISVVFTTGYATGQISVFAINACGVSNTRSITVKRVIPSRPSGISGIPNACLFMPSIAYPAGRTATFSVPSVAGNSYNWTVPAGTSIGLQGSTATTDYIEVNFTAAFTGGNISVTASNGCSTSLERIYALSLNKPAAASPITAVEIQSCPDRQYQYSVTGVPANAISVEWAIPAGAGFVSGQGTTTIIVAYPSTAVTGLVSVVGNNGCSSGAARSVNVHLPACSPFARTGTGELVNKEKAVANLSASVMEVNVFPNPTTYDFKLQVFTAGKEKIKVRLLDAQGRLFKAFEMMPYQTIEVGAGLKAGIYLVEVKQAGKIKTTRVIKF